MLAARGVSLGLGGRINLSELSYLPKDKMMLDKMNRLKRENLAEQRAQQARLVVRKHVDSKTLWTACANVIVGVVMISIGLVMTVIGYFDSASSMPVSDQQKHSFADSSADFSWVRYILKSMQYIGPVFCGIGMFLMIIACVITLESRDRHAQVIQEESTELRRSRRYASQQRKEETDEVVRTESGPIRENGLRVMCARRHTHSSGDNPKRRRELAQPSLNETVSSAADDTIGAQRQQQEERTSRKCHSKAQQCLMLPPSSFNVMATISDASNTDPAVDEYTLLGRDDEAVVDEQRNKRTTTTRRKSASAVQTVNRVRPTGSRAPLVRVESVVELTLSTSGSPRWPAAD